MVAAKSLKIGAVARAAGVAVETVRYYEKEGLLVAPDRRPSGYRQYDESVVLRLKFIRQTKDLGFTLKEIRELLRLRFDATTRCEHVRELAQRKIDDIETRIASLRAVRRTLKRVLRECACRGSVSECPLLNSQDGSRENHDES